MLYDSPTSHPLRLLQGPANRSGTESRLSLREDCHMVSHLHHFLEQVFFVEPPSRAPHPTCLYLQGAWSPRTGRRFISVWECLGGGVERPKTCAQRSHRELDPGVGFMIRPLWWILKLLLVPAEPSATLMSSRDPFFSTESVWFHPLLRHAGKPGALQSQAGGMAAE